ncbi:unnamed protein product [Prorocentrum cordatum]|uniref:14-3-3 domain-containing protein n=1 Tax=Prorocentrum cordatum TaxID=2364126 RepID=A0ABN9PR44_9DINO|nr:unnamed protein product [Polarella glacialis]
MAGLHQALLPPPADVDARNGRGPVAACEEAGGGAGGAERAAAQGDAAACAVGKDVYFARLAEEAERYDDMAAHMEAAGKAAHELSPEERHLLSVAYKSAVGSRRAAWRVLKSKERGDSASFAREYCAKVRGGHGGGCTRIVDVLDGRLIPNAQTGESRVFYKKMKADYYRYVAEYTQGDAKRKAAQAYEEAFKAAENARSTDVPVTHPIRLGLALNYSVFQYEVLSDPDEACKTACTAFADAVTEFDNVVEDPYKDSATSDALTGRGRSAELDSALILQLLRDNLTLWSSDQEDDAPPAGTQPSSPSSRPSPSTNQEVRDMLLRHSEQIRTLERVIDDRGLRQQYKVYVDRYTAWRQGDSTGARGELTDEGLENEKNFAANFTGMSLRWEEWVWSRTMSYWISVSFFEGSIFFCISSFLYNMQDTLGPTTYKATTLWGYIYGKVNFLVCTYLMCLETINFSASHGDGASRGDAGAIPQKGEDKEFYWNPFRRETAIERLKKAGASPLSYYTALVYFVGVLFFILGMSMEFLPVGLLPHMLEAAVLRWSFIVGSLCFTFGGLIECKQNFQVIEAEAKGYSRLGLIVGSINTIGGVCFLVGSLTRAASYGHLCFGFGSALYTGASFIQIVMWKDEQFGLSFLPSRNKFYKRARCQMGKKTSGDTPSWRGVLFITLCCWCGAMSAYNFSIEMAKHFRLTVRSDQMSFEELMPFLYCHAMLLLTSAVVRAPEGPPYRQLLIFMRVMCVAVTVNSTITWVEFLTEDIQE